MRGEAKQSFSPIRFNNMLKWKDVPSLVDDGTLDYVVMLPDGSVHRFNSEYVWDTFASHSGIVATLPDNLAEQLAKEVIES
tara:strand:- start:152 stop:394 length:243 start_codon:yes stop_codon:yes gene_type:complete